MTREENLQKEIDNLSEKERFERTSIKGFKKRGKLIFDYYEVDKKILSFYITQNEFPYKNFSEHLVVWFSEKTDQEKMQTILKEKYLFSGYFIYISPKKSVSTRPHFHLLKK